MFIKFLTKDYIVAHASLAYEAERRRIVEDNMLESMRIYREGQQSA